MQGDTKIYNQFKLFCFALLAGGIIYVSKPAFAESTKGCATDTWVAMTNQATLETRREDMVNKRYIVKSDSVLQYSCFSRELENARNNIGPLFSNGDHWVGRTVALIEGRSTSVDIYNTSLTILHEPTDQNNYAIQEGSGHDYKNGYALSLLSASSLGDAITLTVYDTLTNYISGNFGNTVLAGTTSLTDNGLCYNMANVWRAAKCKNFDDTEVFYRFEDLANFDPREFPSTMRCN